MSDLDALIEAAAERGAQRALAANDVHRLAWTVPEVATSLGTSPDSVRRLIREGHLAIVPHMGTRQLIPVAALEEFVSPGSAGTAASLRSVSPLQRPQAVVRGTHSTADGGSHPPSAA